MPQTTAAGKGKKNKNKKRRGRKGKKEKEEEDLTDLEVPRRARDFEFELDDFSTSQRLNKVKFTTLVALCERRNIGVRQIVRPKKKKKTKAVKTAANSTAGGKTGGGRRGAVASSANAAAAKKAAAAAAAAAASDSDSEDSTENPRLDFDDKQVLVDRILEWRAARKEKRREAAMFGELMRRRQEKFHSAARDAATPKVYKRMCRRCGLVWQTEEVPEQYGAFELRYADRDCERCRFPQRFRPPEEEEDPLDRRLREIRAMSVKQLTAEVEAQGLAATTSGGGGGGGGVAASPTVYSAKYGSRDGPLRPRPSKAALVARLERHERRKQGRLKAGAPPAPRRREPPARTRALTQGISLHAFAENAIRNDLRRLEERARQVLAEVDSGRPKTIQEYQEEFVTRHIHIQAERERSAAAGAVKQGEGQREGAANKAQGAEGQRGSGSGGRGARGKTVIRN